MARGLNLLQSRFVTTTTEEGRHSDGGGLYLLVRRRSGEIERLFVFRYKRGARGAVKERMISLGSARDVTLAAARDMARTCREAVGKGQDPKDALGRLLSKAPTFGAFADDLVKTLCESFESEATKANWRRTLGDRYCAGMRKKPVDQIGTEDVLRVLRDIWQTKPETARKTRERIERVLDAARAAGHREGENPARWKGHLQHLLGEQKAKKGHHRALAYPKLPEMFTRLRALDSISALALEWTILTIARTGEAIGAPRSEIDREAKVWVVPASRMKERREHRVPLCDRCIEIFDEMEKFSNVWLFPARDARHHMSSAAMSECLRGLGVDGTVHGMRATFRSWAQDCTAFPREIVEAAMSHLVGDEAERAYVRSDALERRRKLMDAWAGYCSGQIVGNVVPMKRA